MRRWDWSTLITGCLVGFIGALLGVFVGLALVVALG